MKPIHVVGLGLGPDDLTNAVAQLVAQAEVLAGGSRLVDFFSGPSGRAGGPGPAVLTSG